MAASAFMAAKLFTPLSTPFSLSHSTSSLSGSKLCPSPSAPLPCTPPPSRLLIQARKNIQGKVVCSANDKTVAVEVVRIAPHPRYKKRTKSSKRYHAHDPDNRCKVGDVVTLTKCAPVSKTKKFMVVGIKQGRSLPTKLEEQLLAASESSSA